MPGPPVPPLLVGFHKEVIFRLLVSLSTSLLFVALPQILVKVKIISKVFAVHRLHAIWVSPVLLLAFYYITLACFRFLTNVILIYFDILFFDLLLTSKSCSFFFARYITNTHFLHLADVEDGVLWSPTASPALHIAIFCPLYLQEKDKDKSDRRQ